MQSVKNAVNAGKGYAESGRNYVEKMAGRDTEKNATSKIDKPSRNIANNQSQLQSNLQNQNKSSLTNNQSSSQNEQFRSNRPETTKEIRQNEPRHGTVREETIVSKERTELVDEQPTKPTYNQVRNRVDPNVTTRDTQVEELVNPAVVKERIRPTERERTNLEFQRELHQDHYQTRVQPVTDREVLPEQHVNRTLPTEYREHRCGNKQQVQDLLDKEHAEFKDSRHVLPGERSTEDGHIIAEETRHHHVHEIVQPVLEREVVQPTVIHTTAPIHERIEKDATFHPKTVQPTMTLDEFHAAGGTLDGRSATSKETFEGEPQVLKNGGANVKHPQAGHRTQRTTSNGATTRTEYEHIETEGNIYSPEETSKSRQNLPGSFPDSSKQTQSTSTAGPYTNTRSGANNTSTSGTQSSKTLGEQGLKKKPSLTNRLGSAVESTGQQVENIGKRMQ